MLEVLADENFKQQIVNGLRRRIDDLRLTTAAEADLLGTPDPGVLAWAAHRELVVLTHDTRTMKSCAYARVAAGEPMPGVLEVPDLMPIGEAIEELGLVIELLEPEEIRDRVLRLPV